MFGEVVITNLIRRVVPRRFRPIGYLEHLAHTHSGGAIPRGPFAGMRYITDSVGSALVPKLLGIYERELNECIEQACTRQFPLIIDVGAAEGYYAVGLARRNPNARVIAFEMEEKGRATLRIMAELNGVEVQNGEATKAESRNLPKAEKLKIRSTQIANSQLSTLNSQPSTAAVPPPPRIELHGKCEPDDLALILASAERSLIVCDVEGYEDVLLVPEKIPGLTRAHLLVEMHDFCCPGITDRITARFAATHRIERIWQKPRTRADLPYRTLGTALLPGRYLDWAVSEWRPARMSWLWMTPNAEISKAEAEVGNERSGLDTLPNPLPGRGGEGVGRADKRGQKSVSIRA